MGAPPDSAGWWWGRDRKGWRPIHVTTNERGVPHWVVGEPVEEWGGAIPPPGEPIGSRRDPLIERALSYHWWLTARLSIVSIPVANLISRDRKQFEVQGRVCDGVQKDLEAALETLATAKREGGLIGGGYVAAAESRMSACDALLGTLEFANGVTRLPRPD